jgi:hypothetical protein
LEIREIIQLCLDIKLSASDILVKCWGSFGSFKCNETSCIENGTYLERHGLELAPIAEQTDSAVRAFYRLLSTPELLIGFDIR